MKRKWVAGIFAFFVYISLLAPLLTSRDLLFPYITTKAFFLRIALELALPFYLYLVISDPKLRPNLKNPLTISLLAFLAVNFLSAIFGINFIRSMWGNFERMGGAYYIAHLVLLYFYVLLLGQLGGRYLKNFLLALIAVSLAVTVNGIFGKLGLPTLVQDPSLPGRVSSTLGNPIYMGSFLVIPLFLTLFFAVQAETRWKKWAYVIASFLLSVGILLSGTRGALVGLVGGIFVSGVLYLLFAKNSKARKWGWAGLGVFILSMGLLYAVHEKLPAGSEFRRLFQLRDSNSQARLVQWQAALQGFKDYPLLGAGPENYYYTANFYYNPELFKYDRSWFDKPHNYLLEILVTNGAVGLAVYCSIFVFAVWAFWRAFREGFYGAMEFCLLMAAILVYQLQNLFVFDTIPASQAFYALLGFAGYLWMESGRDEVSKKDKPAEGGIFPAVAASVGGLIVIYAIVVTNLTPMAAAKNINYGYAYGSAGRLAESKGYFEDARRSAFNFDKGELATKYADIAARSIQSAPPQQQETAREILGNSLEVLEYLVNEQPNYATYWYSLASTYLARGVVLENRIEPRAIAAIEKKMELAPNRIEGRMFLARVRIYQSNFSEAEKLLEGLAKDFPSSMETKALLAQLYRNDGRGEQAFAIMEELLESGYKWENFAEVKWVADAYAANGNPAKAASLYEEALRLNPSDAEIALGLARLYAQAGNNGAAIDLAKAIMNSLPEKKTELSEFINSLSGK